MQKFHFSYIYLNYHPSPRPGAIQVLRNADGVGGVNFSGKKRYEGERLNVIGISKGWVRKKC